MGGGFRFVTGLFLGDLLRIVALVGYRRGTTCIACSNLGTKD